MIFHMGYELPEPKPKVLNHEESDLTHEEVRILKEQIRKNSASISDHIERLDLLVNKERHPDRAASIRKIRDRLSLLMDENDTFRKVLWKHFQMEHLQDPLQ